MIRTFPTLVLAGLVLALAACSPSAPPGVDKDQLDEALSKAIGDPNTCVLIAERASGRVLYRYNTLMACRKDYPACDRSGMADLEQVLKATAKDGQPRLLSCYTEADRSRGVGWASGPVAGKPYVYAAVMEGERAFPGRMMAGRVENAFRRAGLSAAP